LAYLRPRRQHIITPPQEEVSKVNNMGSAARELPAVIPPRNRASIMAGKAQPQHGTRDKTGERGMSALAMPAAC